MDREDVIKRVVGKAVHPKAVERLIQLLPDAYVEVNHASADARYDGLPARWTMVRVWNYKPESDTVKPYVVGRAHCHPTDQFSRSMGIKLAFNRALKEIPRQRSVAEA